MVKKIQKDEVPPAMKEYFPEAYRCEVCGCLFNSKELAERCEARDVIDNGPVT